MLTFEAIGKISSVIERLVIAGGIRNGVQRCPAAKWQGLAEIIGCGWIGFVEYSCTFLYFAQRSNIQWISGKIIENGRHSIRFDCPLPEKVNPINLSHILVTFLSIKSILESLVNSSLRWNKLLRWSQVWNEILSTVSVSVVRPICVVLKYATCICVHSEAVRK